MIKYFFVYIYTLMNCNYFADYKKICTKIVLVYL